jgi:hypothetical protein
MTNIHNTQPGGRASRHMPKRISRTVLAALAVSAVGVSLGTAIAHADQVKPGLDCVVDWGNVSCTNTTDVGYTVT